MNVPPCFDQLQEIVITHYPHGEITVFSEGIEILFMPTDTLLDTIYQWDKNPDEYPDAQKIDSTFRRWIFFNYSNNF